MGGQWHKIGDKGGKTSGRRTHHPTQAHICGETRRDKTSGRRAHLPTRAHMCGDNGTGTGHNCRQWETRGEKTSGRRTYHPTKGDKKALKADTPSNTGTHVARQWETIGDKGRQGEKRPREGRHTIQQRETKRETRGDKASATRKKGHKGRQDLGNA